MIFCKIENGSVTNRAFFEGEMPEQWAEPGDVWIQSDTAQIGWLYAGGMFSPPPAEPDPPAPRPMILKSVVQSRIIDAGKMGAAYAALTSNPVYFARWFAPDRPAVYCDDPDAVGLVRALGLDPEIILAETSSS